MKKFIRGYSAYNSWANEKLCAVITTLNEEQLNQQITTSFPSIRKTLQHIWDGQIVWITRLEGASPIAFHSSNFSGTSEEIWAGVMASSKKLEALTKSFGKKDLEKEISYLTFNGEKYSTPVYQILAHLFNHNTYHRGQLITMLRQVGITQLPKTDLIAFYREKK